ncbi:F-box domain-containing protein [Psidium guajava]|nr:F-box domain-containing protein [Psidium guajava]
MLPPHPLCGPRLPPPGRVLPLRRFRTPPSRPRRPPSTSRSARPPRSTSRTISALAGHRLPPVSDAPAPSSPPIPDSEKDQIKALIVRLMLSSSARIQSQLSEALAVISKHDFPKLWPALLPDLVSNVQKASQASDYASINGILGTARSSFASSKPMICCLI